MSAQIVNFDQLGTGQICGPSGQTIISSSTDGSGFRSNAKGLVIARWNAAGKVTPEPVRNVDASDPLSANPSATRIPVRVSDSLGVVYDVPSRSVEVWFQCRGIRHKFVQGHNPACAASESPPPEFATSSKPKRTRGSPNRQHAERSPVARPRKSPSAGAGNSSGVQTHAQTLADIRAAVSSL